MRTFKFEKHFYPKTVNCRHCSAALSPALGRFAGVKGAEFVIQQSPQFGPPLERQSHAQADWGGSGDEAALYCDDEICKLESTF